MSTKYTPLRITKIATDIAAIGLGAASVVNLIKGDLQSALGIGVAGFTSWSTGRFLYLIDGAETTQTTTPDEPIGNPRQITTNTNKEEQIRRSPVVYPTTGIRYRDIRRRRTIERHDTDTRYALGRG